MYFKYLRAVLRHKRFVYEEGRRIGLGRWQLLVHDLSKFLPCEFIPYARQFYGSYPARRDVPSELWMRCGVRTKEEVKADFDRAWLHHQHANPHHWQHYVLREDSGKVKVLPMPWKYRLEMLADWRGAGRAFGDGDTASWYRKTAAGRLLHDETRAWVEHQLGIV